MSQPEISPLAKRLAEENNVDWHALQGSGPAGKVVERDVLEYLSRVMAGEEDINPTPEPTPDGMDSWPEEDVVNYQQETQANVAPSTTTTHSDDMLVTDDLLADDIDLLDGEDFSDDITEDVFLLEDDDDMSVSEDSSFVEQLHNNVDASGHALYGRESRAAANGVNQGIAASGDASNAVDSGMDDDLLSTDTLDDTLDDDLLSADFSDDSFGDFSDTMDESLDSFSDSDFGDADFSDSDFVSDNDADFSDADSDFTDDGFADTSLDADFAAPDLSNDTFTIEDGDEPSDETSAMVTDTTFSDAGGDTLSFEEDASDFAAPHDADLLAMDMDSTNALDSNDVQALGDLDAGNDFSLDDTGLDDTDLDDTGLDDTDLDDTGLDDIGLNDTDADLLAMDSDMLLDDSTEGGFDTESDHVHFDNTEVGEGASPVAESELRSDAESFDTESDHDHLGDTMASASLEDSFEDALEDTGTFTDAIDDTSLTFDDGDDSLADTSLTMDDTFDSSADVFASDDDVFSDAASDMHDGLDAMSDSLDDALEADLSVDMPDSQEMGNNFAAAAGAVAAGGAVAAASTGFQHASSQQPELQPVTSFESNYQDDSATTSTSMEQPAHVQATMQPTPVQPAAMTTTSSMALASGEGRTLTLRRYLDLELFNELQEQIVAALGEEATVAMVQKAALKALEEVPLTGHNVNIFDLNHNHVKAIPNAGDMSLSGLVRAMHNASEGASDMLVADLSRLEVDEIGMDMGVPLLTLGRILWSGEDGQSQSSVAMLALSGNVNPEMGSRFLAVAAEMLENPLLLLL